LCGAGTGCFHDTAVVGIIIGGIRIPGETEMPLHQGRIYGYFRGIVDIIDVWAIGIIIIVPGIVGVVIASVIIIIPDTIPVITIPSVQVVPAISVTHFHPQVPVVIIFIVIPVIPFLFGFNVIFLFPDR